MQKLALYIHWPFCLSKCSYCDFNSHVRETIDQDRWLKAYLSEIDHYAELTKGRMIASIFFGGGTPSLMPESTVDKILQRIRNRWSVANDVEITLEANPTSVEIDKFSGFRLAGVNRVSIGVQALDDKVLKFLGREHDAKEAIKAIETAQTVFDRYSFDLMYARPEQSLKDWKHELSNALTYASEHLSLYQLTIEKQTPFYLQYQKGVFEMPDSDLAADFFMLTQDILNDAALPIYEVSNHAKSGYESVHNLTYWFYNDYVGVGAGAHGRLTLNNEKFATRGHRSPEIWLEKVERRGHGAQPYQKIDGPEQKIEALMMGLRTRYGVDRGLIPDQKTEELNSLVENGFLSIKTIDDDQSLSMLQNRDYDVPKEKVLPTMKGLLNLNNVILKLI